MGAGIAALFVSAGWRVQILVRSAEKWSDLELSVHDLTTQIRSVRPDAESDTGELSRCATVQDIEWTNVALVIETVTENKALKQELFAQLDQLVPPGIPIATNTSGMRITEIANQCATKNRMAHAHFFMPAHLVPLVEVAGADFTDGQVLDRLMVVFEAIGCVPVRINSDVPGLLANRIQHALTREALSVVQSGLANAEDVDKAVRFGFGFRYVAAGPLLQKEFSGLDTLLASASAVYPSLCNDSEPAQVLKDTVAAGHYGVKTGQGFRAWPDEKVKVQYASYQRTLLAAAKLLAEK
jgi:3-hydroxybutyryl-CoA dehydrogenase